MASMVLGIGTSHTPMNSMPAEYWGIHGELSDKRNKELVSLRSRTVKPYEELEAEADPAIREQLTPEVFQAKYDRIQRAIAEVSRRLRAANPDSVIVISDDQDEWLFEDNMPAFMIYWGETAKIIPWPVDEKTPPAIRAARWGYGDKEMDVPVDSALGKHLIEYLIEAEFDVAHARYMKEAYGGSIGPDGYVWWKRETPPRAHGLPHGFAYIIRRVMENDPIPIVPVFQNTCYPPNQPTPRRSYALGKAIRAAIDDWSADKRVVVIGSGGLSHFVLDEETDRIALDAMAKHDAETLCSLARERLQSAASEIQNWIAAAGACEDKQFNLIDYVPVARTAAGTGGGWAFASWD